MSTSINRLGFVTDASTGHRLGRVHKIEQNCQPELSRRGGSGL